MQYHLLHRYARSVRVSVTALPARHILIILFIALATTGCTTIKRTLQPWVCECAAPSDTMLAGSQAAGDGDDTDEGSALDEGDDSYAIGTDGVEGDEGDESGSLVASTGQSSDEMDALGDEEEAAPGQANVRRVARQSDPEALANDPAHMPFDAVEGIARVDLDSAEARRAFEARHNVKIPDQPGVVAMSGSFIRNEDNAAIVIPGQSIRIYSGGRLAAQRNLSNQAASVALDELSERPIEPVRLVHNGSLQVLVHYAEVDPAGSIDYRVAIYKVIGNDIGTIFERTLARRASAEAPLQRLGALEFLQGRNHRFIRWTPLDEQGQPVGEPEILRWNRWEGVYRLPVPPPTAPRRDGQVKWHTHAPTFAAR